MIVYHMSETLRLGDRLEPDHQRTEALCRPFIQALERSEDCFAAMVKAQHGDPEQILHPEQLPFAAIRHEVKATKSGYVHHMDTEGIGLTSMLLGAGRAKKEDSLDYGAGIYLRKKTGEAVEAGETLAVFYTSDGSRIPAAETRFLESVFIRPEAPEPEPLVYGHVS